MPPGQAQQHAWRGTHSPSTSLSKQGDSSPELPHVHGQRPCPDPPHTPSKGALSVRQRPQAVCVQTRRRLSASKPLLRASWRQARAALSLWMEGGEEPAPGSSPPGRSTQGSGLRALRGEGELRPPGSWQPSREDRKRVDDDRVQGPVQGTLSL